MTEAIVRAITASDGYRLHFRHWQAQQTAEEENRCRGIIIGLHGIQSHSGWYVWSAEQLANAGFDVYFADRRGSGLNEQDRGHADHGLRLINDVRQLIALARHEHSGAAEIPVTLMALSWGAKIGAALTAAFPREIDRLVLLYPGLEPRIGPTRWQRWQLNMARDFDIRRKSVRIPLGDPAWFTDNPEWQDFIRRDPLALHQVTSGFLNAGRDLHDILISQAERIQHPVLAMLAGRDQIIDNQRTRERLQTFGTRRMTIVEYPFATHTLEFDLHRSDFVNDLIHWLGAATKKKNESCLTA